MVLRVYAMWDRSRTVLGILLFIYMAQMIVNCVWVGITLNPNETLFGMFRKNEKLMKLWPIGLMFLPLFPVSVDNTPRVTFCTYASLKTSFPPLYRSIPRFVLSGILLILTVMQVSKQVVDMYRLTKRWQINQYMKLFVREGVLYFILYVFFVPSSHFYISIIRPSPLALSLTNPQRKNWLPTCFLLN